MRFAMQFLFTWAIVIGTATGATAQSRILRPQPTPTIRRHVTTLRSSDSAQGSRVTVSSDQSMSEYEAYRQGDKFYLRIPATDVPRVEAVHGRGFADVTTQNSGDKTLVAFRLRPGASAHVEQQGTHLDVVITVPGTSASTRPGSITPTQPLSTHPFDLSAPRNSNAHANVRDAKPAVASATPKPAPVATPRSTPSPTPAAKGSPVRNQGLTQQAAPSPIASPANSSGQVPAQNATPTLRQRVRYWILLAQLNPIPVAIGAAVLLFLIGLLILQRRRARATHRTRWRKPPKEAAPIAADAKPVAATAEDTLKPDVMAVTAAGVAATTAKTSSEIPADPDRSSPRQERVERVSDEVKKLMAGGDYDERLLASDDRETRQLVGAELLSALVGRNLQRRERARAAFMKHGYFDDATRDLRIGDSANERAAAARRLSFVHEREATPHLIAALDDPSPDVRRAAVEALMDLRDPAAIAPLNSLMQNENDRRVPRNLIKQAIESCATTSGDEPGSRLASSLPAATPPPVPPAVEIEREVIEI
ncbi:MAG TPA: HEAT repeat domain-containing protein [Pyrinomonadaceae bacterium]|nr:HEAT repeat domain-containing protein [Pyrinomonadaceae bacterium]